METNEQKIKEACGLVKMSMNEREMEISYQGYCRKVVLQNFRRRLRKLDKLLANTQDGNPQQLIAKKLVNRN
jgi:hypothetical protein